VFLAVAVPGSAVSAVRCSLWFAAAGRAPFPTSYRALTTNLDYKNTWHITAGMQHRLSEPWLLNFEVAYDSGFQNGPNASPMLPVNSAWRFGVGAQDQVRKTFWGVAAEYAYGGALDITKTSQAPVALGGRGDLVGSYRNTGILFVGTYLDLMRISNAPMRNALDHLGQSTRRCL
jgi:hypothetical protein